MGITAPIHPPLSLESVLLCGLNGSEYRYFPCLGGKNDIPFCLQKIHIIQLIKYLICVINPLMTALCTFLLAIRTLNGL